MVSAAAAIVHSSVATVLEVELSAPEIANAAGCNPAAAN